MLTEGFFSVFGLLLLSIFLSFAFVLQQRCEALLQLSYAQEKVNSYVYLLEYIKKECIPTHAEQNEEVVKEWIILQDTNSYRILENDNQYDVYQGMKCILSVKVDDEEQIESILFGKSP